MKAATLFGVVAAFDAIPRVARPSQPWAGGRNAFGIGESLFWRQTPKRAQRANIPSCRERVEGAAAHNPQGGCSFPKCAVDLMKAATLFGVVAAFDALPRVARPSQPRAGGRNAFGIGESLFWRQTLKRAQRANIPSCRERAEGAAAHNPQGGCGSPKWAVGLMKAATPFGVVAAFDALPKVARPSQPRAGGRNAFGIGESLFWRQTLKRAQRTNFPLRVKRRRS